MSRSSREVTIICPVFNEQEVVREFYERLKQALGSGLDYEIVFVDDGSSDQSYNILKEIKASGQDRVRLIKLARNFGHQIAITAGIRAARGNAVVVTDTDLQDPPEIIPRFIEKWKEGNDIVYGVRIKREGESLFKRLSARIFYKFINTAAQIDIPENVGDFYLLDRKIVEILNGMEERHRYIRGLIAWVGFKRQGIEYVRERRHAGKTKYGFWKMVKFSFDATTSFSFVPLRVISYIGSMMSLLSFLAILLIIYMKLFTETTITGWSSLMVVVLFIGGIQLLSIGVIGEYIARIGDDVKKRPLYTVKEAIE